MTWADQRIVPTADIRAAVRGHETDLLDALNIDWRHAKPHIPCPYQDHDDNHPSWRWDGRKCKAFCTCGARDVLGVSMGVEGIGFDAAKIRAAELLKRPDLIRERRARKREGGEGVKPPAQRCDSATPVGCALAAYAEAKRLPIEFLRELGLTQVYFQGVPAIRMPYFGTDGGILAVRFRIALHAKKRFLWRKGSTARLYGLDRLDDARAAGYVVLVEGESDCHTLWHYRYPALGLPGNRNWNEERDANLLADIPIIYIVIEPGQSGEGMLQWLSRSALSSRARLVRLPEKDPSALHCLDPDAFRAAFEHALEIAEPYQLAADRQHAAETAEMIEVAGDLLREPNVLARFVIDLKRAGLVAKIRTQRSCIW